MSYNFCIKNQLSAGKIVRFSKIAAGSTSANLPASQLLNNNLASISIAGSEKLYIEVDNTFNVYLNIDPANSNLVIQKSVTLQRTSWELFSMSNAKSEPTVNVTVGQDEPKSRLWFLVALLIAEFFYLFSGVVREFSGSLWLAIAGILAALLIGATIHYVIKKKKGMTWQKDNSKV